MNQKLKFSKNWNGKLFNNNYTTIRGFYFDRDTLVQVHLNGQFHHTARVKEVLSVKICNIQEWMYLLDTGLDRISAEKLICQLCKKQLEDTVYIMVLQKEASFLDKAL